MLLRFTIENVTAFAAEAEFSMLATREDRHPNHLRSTGGEHPTNVVRAAAIYGANGHGKTKFVEAIELLQTLVLHGRAEGEKIGIRKFRPDKSMAKEPSKFSIDFHVDGVDYEYGISCHENYIAEEWLFGRLKVKKTPYFYRTTTLNTDGEFQTDVEIGATLKGLIKKQKLRRKDFIDYVADGTRPNQPFLTEAVERNVAALKPVTDWFRRCLVIIGAEAHYEPLYSRAQADEKFTDFLSNFMRRADIGIDHIKTTEVKMDLDALDMDDSSRDEIRKICKEGNAVLLGAGEGPVSVITQNKDGDLIGVSLSSVHKNEAGEETAYAMDEESAGTQRLVNLVPMLMDLNTRARTYVVDELDRKLHPLLAYRLIESFFESSGNGQLIFTTHNTRLMSADLLRRDELWLVEKDRNGAATLLSMSDLNIRSDVRLEKGYLQGRFGGIPRDGGFGEMEWGVLSGEAGEGGDPKEG